MVGDAGRVERKEGAMGRGQWGGGNGEGGFFQMECLGGDTFPKQCRVTQLVIV